MDGGGREYGTLGMMGAIRAVDPRRLTRPATLRKPYRYATRHMRALLDGRIAAPRSATAYLHVAVLGGSAILSVALSGQVPRWTDYALARGGFAVANVTLDGATETKDIDIEPRIGLASTRSLPAIDVAASREALMALPWIEAVEIEKVYPGTLNVRVLERKAVAQWRVGPRTLLVDAFGHPIVRSDGRDLPLLVGEGADAAVEEGLALFDAVPAVRRQIKALVRVGDRRWDMVTHRNVVVMLPERAPAKALETLLRFHRSDQLLDRDLASIDLRVADRVALRLPEGLAEARRAKVENAVEQRKKDRASREVSL